MRQPNDLVYHNPETMGREFREIAASGCISADEEKVAERAAEDDGVIWCVGKRGNGKTARYFLYQRIVNTRCSYSKPDAIAQGDFKVWLCGKTTLPKAYEKDITDETYMAQIKSVLGFGIQLLGNKPKNTVEAFEAEYQRTLE
ncbi:hypothetical protein [Deinococcus sp.]|uniref:hypothetical protein n=1 Tax=Deinococcus sp. TaxID=47478 RepID=UPI003CC51510